MSGSALVTLTGTIDLRGGRGTQFEDPTHGRGGDLRVQGGSFVFDAPAAELNVTGGDDGAGAGGKVRLTGGLLTLNGGIIRGTTLSASADPIDLLGADLNVAGGDLIATDAMTISRGGNLNLSSGSVDVTTLRLRTNGNLSFTGGTFSVDTFEGDLAQDGGTLAAGDSPGITNIVGGYDLNAGTLEVEIAGLVQGTEHDFYDVTGDVNLAGGALDVRVIDPFAFVLDQTFDILSVGGALSGTFAGLAEGAVVDTFPGGEVLITYAAGDGNDIALLTVPEPASLTVAGSGALTLLSRRRRGRARCRSVARRRGPV
ncbi:MAG: hypothetical protein CMJ18_05750 [Phycisphaeraceae bacterium]|nr:hypothetical protein [Phycisphaeraceae bacterium]